MPRRPPITLALAVAAVLAATLAACSHQQPAPTPTTPTTTTHYAQQLFEGINNERTEAGEQQLTWNDCLAAKAIPRAQKTISEDTLEHEQLTATCLGNVAAGENLSRGAFTPSEIVKKWMASPGHAANILREGFTHAGVGCVEMPDAPNSFACSLLFEGGS